MSVVEGKKDRTLLESISASISGVSPSVAQASKDVEIVSLLKKYNQVLPIGFLANLTGVPYSSLLVHLQSLADTNLVKIDPSKQTVQLTE